MDEKGNLMDPFFGLNPTDTPKLLAPEIISTSITEYNGTFSTDGTEFFYTSEVPGKSIITFTKLDSITNIWSSPEIASFSGKYSEYDPLFSPDGNRLYFSSERPTPENPQSNNTNIWFVERNQKGWSLPQYVPLSGKGDYFSSVTNEGDIYYNIWNTGNILKASKTDTGYVSIVLPDAINGKSDVGDPFISPNEDYLIFRGYFREGFGRGDLYISFKIEGEWTEPENLGEPINSSAHEICPYVTTDGRLFIFSSDRLNQQFTNKKEKNLDAVQKRYQSYDNGNSNIYYISADFIEVFRKRHKSKERALN